MNTYATIRISTPTKDIEALRTVLELQTSTAKTVRDYLDLQVLHLAAAFGPNCTTEILEVGTHESS